VGQYKYQKPGADAGRLKNEAVAAGILVDFVRGPDVLGDVTVTTVAELDAAGKAALSAAVAAHDPRPRRPRPLHAILADLLALQPAQQTAIWTDLTSGTPPKWRTTSSDPCVWAKATQGTTTAMEKAVGVAFYCREAGHERYLVNPAFAPAINIDASEVIT
jgi:hypothetical protein